MGVVWLFLKVTDWCILLIGWILCIPLRIQLNVLRWIHPHLVAIITIDEKKSKDIKITPPPDVQDLHRQLNQAIEDKKHASTQYTEMKNDVSHLQYKCEQMKMENEQLEQGNQRLREKCQRFKETESDSSGFKDTHDTNLKHQFEQLKVELENAHANLKSLQQEKDLLQQTKQKEVDAIRQGVDGDVKKLHQKDSDISVFKKAKASLSSDNTNLKRQLAKLNEELENAHENLKSLEDEKIVLQETNKNRLDVILQGVDEDVKNLKVRIESLQNELQEEMTKYDTAVNENCQLKARVTGVKIQLADTLSNLKQTEIEKDDAVRRLSEMMSLRLRDNNPNIVDLNDQFRPTKLAEMMNELYDNQWTDVFSFLEDNWNSSGGREFSDTMCIEFLLNILMETYTFCRKSVIGGWQDCISKLFWTADTKDEQDLLKKMKDVRKKNALLALPIIQQQCYSILQTLRLTNDGVFGIDVKVGDEVQAYIDECVRSCWLMSLQDPPVCLVCEGWESNGNRNEAVAIVNVNDSTDNPCSESDDNLVKDAERKLEDNQCHDTQGEIETFSKTANGLLVANGCGHSIEDMKDNTTPDLRIDVPIRKPFEKDLYREYTKRGKYLDYIVWPIMYLHENGPVLNKGVAQGCT